MKFIAADRKNWKLWIKNSGTAKPNPTPLIDNS